jgi:hypothetical protein
MANNLNYAWHSMNFERTHNKSFSEAAASGRQVQMIQAYEYLRDISHAECAWFVGPHKNWKDVGYLQRPPLTGQGVITISHATMGRHAVAFGEGLIFDSSAPCALPWELWREVSFEWRVDGWQRARLAQ